MDISYNENGTEKYFPITGSDNDKVTVLNLEDRDYPIYIFVFSEIEQKKQVEYIYLGVGHKEKSDQGLILKVSIKQKLINKSIIANYVSCSEIDLTLDYGLNSYVTVENSPGFVKQMSFIASPPYQYISSTKNTEYLSLKEEEFLHPLAQKNEYCKREYPTTDVDNERGEFRRDLERIIHSKAFRRMVDKAQIFSAKKGDYYRTRMTHSLAVKQIAQGISAELKLNNFLTEAIALGHDIGHTPFGHQGERTLSEILSEKEQFFEKEYKIELSYGGFKHNYQSLRVATRLEEKYIDFDGLNLCFQTLDGIWKHTKTKKEVILSEFVSHKPLLSYLTCETSIPCTLEGQIVKIADEIAQRSHDLEDAFSANRLLLEDLKNYLLLNKTSLLKEQIEQIENSFAKAVNSNRLFAHEKELLHGRISSKIINFFIVDVLKQSNINIDLYVKNSGIEKFKNDDNRVSESIINFSESGQRLNDYIERIINKRVINSTEVSLFDSNGAAVVRALFNSYYNNPRLLHKGTIHRIMQDYRSITKNVIDFEEGDPGIIRQEWNKIIVAKSDADDLDLVDNEYLEKNRSLVKNIIDFIAGMTDSYAINEYNRILR